jgi:hypothetical protein
MNCDRGVGLFFTQGVALGYHVSAPSGRGPEVPGRNPAGADRDRLAPKGHDMPAQGNALGTGTTSTPPEP